MRKYGAFLLYFSTTNWSVTDQSDRNLVESVGKKSALIDTQTQ